MSARLRKAFRYPTEDDHTDSRHLDDELDDDQQEAVVTALREHDEKSLFVYRTLFTALPLLAILAFLPFLLSGSERQSVLIALLSITSLASTAYIIHYIPVIKDGERLGGRTGIRQRALFAELDAPVPKYLPYLNGGLAVVLSLFGIIFWSRGKTVAAIWALVPGAIYVVVMVARHDLVPMDICSLEKLRYPYRGA